VLLLLLVVLLEIGEHAPLFLWARGRLTYYVPQIFPENFSPTIHHQAIKRNGAGGIGMGTEAGTGTGELPEIMEITLDSGLPSVLCCYQEDYHRRPVCLEGT
jgi:hypothetical protein